MFTTLPVQTALTARAGSLEVRLATSLAEIDAAMRLRYEVFNLELMEGLQASYDRGFDADAYDGYCDHLIVEDLDARKTVGTYRLLRRSVAERNIGFYSENEFDLCKLKRHAGEMVELRRSCIARSHRSFATINLLWSAMSSYAVAHDARYLFGCGSLHVASVEEGNRSTRICARTIGLRKPFVWSQCLPAGWLCWMKWTSLSHHGAWRGCSRRS